jgi:hypothetical protein
MSWGEWFLLYAVLHLPALFLCYAIWIQHERGGWCKVLHFFGIVGFPVDVFANYTTLAIIFWRWPGKSFTFSKHLSPLSALPGRRGDLARKVAAILNRIAPSGAHIKAPAKDV